ncbi:hypothetical protein JI58_05275 [Marinosulfonomonas sp. PRT-SC04]|nr:hypothetical protein JI58_05275 [Marinosulfonomonas sp. PRT-SC04]
MKDWWSISDLHKLGCGALPKTISGIQKRADKEWANRVDHIRKAPVEGGARGSKREYHIAILPPEVQREIVRRDEQAKLKAMQPKTDAQVRKESLWLGHAKASKKNIAKAQKRLDIVNMFEKQKALSTAKEAEFFVAKEFGVSPKSVQRYRAMVRGICRTDRLPALIASSGTGRPKTKVHEEAFEKIKGDYARNEEPSFQSCYDRLIDVAEANGWEPIPPVQTLKRHVDEDIGFLAMKYAREGEGAVTKLYPAQERDKSCFHAMEAVDADGHLADTMVKFPDGTIGRPIILGFQDLYSNVVVGWRIGLTENTYLIQLAAADMIESFGKPKDIWFDNGSAFWSKVITGGKKNKSRRKFKPSEQLGMLPSLGCTVHATKPYHGQGKPIERFWKDFCDRVAKHPSCAGAYVGKDVLSKPANYGSNVVPYAIYEQVVAAEINRHNTKEGRNSKIAAGRSYAQVYRDSVAQPDVHIPQATEHEVRMLYMAQEDKMIRKDQPAIHIDDNRYWAEELVEYAGRKVTVRYDPKNMYDDLFVYTAKEDRFICRAPCVAAVEFNDRAEMRKHANAVSAYVDKIKKTHKEKVTLSIEEVAAQIPDIDYERLSIPKVVGLNFIDVHTPYADGTEKRTEVEQAQDRADAAAFGRGIAASVGTNNIFDMPKSK